MSLDFRLENSMGAKQVVSNEAERAKVFRRKYLRYKDAEVIYSMQHKKMLELADRAGALYRIDGYVLINRDIFDEYLEQFKMPPQQTKTGGHNEQ